MDEDRMPVPTIVVGRKMFGKLAFGMQSQFVIHGKKGCKYVPDTAQEIGDNMVVFPRAAKAVIFRQRFTRRTVRRDVRYVTADRSERYDLKFIFYLK